MRTAHLTAPLLATLLGSACLAGCVQDEPATTSDFASEVQKPTRMAPDQVSAEENWAIWKEYCVGDAEITQRPLPNYDNAEVMEAAVRLSRVERHSFALYGDFKSHHKTEVPAELAETIREDAHDFLSYLCGEFRDRATMIAAKVRWVATMNYLDNEDTGAYDPAGDPWQQMKQDDYHPYIQLSNALWTAKRGRLDQEGRRTMQVGSLTVDTPVPAQTICETKYMFAEYVKKARTFDGLEAFETGYPAFRDENCALPEDEDYFYDFRGDSNIKPNSPESNGMIWVGRSIARQCDSRKGAEPYQHVREESSFGDDICHRYFKYPFTTRWNAARAGLATWVLVDPDLGGLDSNSQFTVIPRNESDDNYLFGDKGPYRALNSSGEPVQLLEGYSWRFGAMGLPELHNNDKERIHKLLQLAVDRHTDWYNSGYDDQMTFKNYKNNKAYSPFVASSYEMSKSDHFVTPGTTVPVIDPESRKWKHFMFVFRVHKDNWYTPEKINAEDVPLPNFDRVWIDETSFGETSLANSERAWDRLGTALEDEIDSVLYLRNISSGSF
jgi:hypothetical protein